MEVRILDFIIAWHVVLIFEKSKIKFEKLGCVNILRTK
jgi:hypothetical protein